MIKFQFEVSDERADQIEALQRKLQLRKKDLFNTALTLLEWAVKERETGSVLASVNEAEGKYKEILMPVLEAVPVGQAREPVGAGKPSQK